MNSPKNLIFKIIAIFIISFSVMNNSYSQRTTVSSGSWNSAARWSAGGVPGNATATVVNHALILDKDLTITGNLTINQPVIDPDGGSNHTLTVNSGGNVVVDGNMQVQGVLDMNGDARLLIKSGDTLFIGYPGSTETTTIGAGTVLSIEAGGVLIIYGNLTLESGLFQTGTIMSDGEILIDGNFHGENFSFIIELGTSEVTGSGSLTTTGSMTTDGSSTVHGSGTNCNSGPCASSNPCGIANSIGSAQSICSGATPSTLTGSTHAGVTYQWQKSTSSIFTGYSNISGATSANLTFSSGVSVATWYRRVARVTAGGCINTSAAVKISMATPPTASVSIVASSTNFCQGTNVTFTATPTNGGTTPAYQWQINGVDVSGATGNTFSTTTLSNGDAIRVIMTSNSSCVAGSPATSNVRTVTVNTPGIANVTISAPVTTFCNAAPNTTFTASPTNGGGSPSYVFRRRRGASDIIVRAASTTATYTTNDLQHGDSIYVVMTSNSTCVAGSPATSNKLYIVETPNSSAGNWTGGGGNSNWNTTTNWCGGIPTSSIDATIYGGAPRDPIANSNSPAQVSRDLTLSSNAFLRVNGGNLTVNRNLVINSGSVLTVQANSLSVTGTITINSGGTLNLTGGTLTAGNTITINSGGTLNVSGGTMTVANAFTINTGGSVTHSGGTITLNNTLTINSSGSYATTSGTTTANGSIAISSGGSLSITNPAVFASKSHIVNNGSISGSGTFTINNGASNQNLSGSGAYGNTTLNNGAGCTALSAITIGGTLTLTAGQFRSNGNLTMDLTTGNIAHGGAGTIQGNLIYSKTIPSAGYHYISVPSLTNKTAADWNDDVTLSFGQYKNIYYYDETVANSDKLVGWTALTSTADALSPLQGYALYFPGPRVIDVTDTYTPGATPTALTLTNTLSSDPNSDGWNLVGNPYPTTVDWDVSTAGAWTKTGIGNSIYFWNPDSLKYASYVGQVGAVPGYGTNGGTKYIPSMQAFWVRVNSVGSGTFSVGNAARVSSSNPGIWRMSSSEGFSNTLKIITKNKFNSDETILRFVESAENSFDPNYDAYKMKNEGNAPNIFTSMGDDLYSVNTLSDNVSDLSVPLHLEGVAGVYTIDIHGLENFDASYGVYLEDKLLNTTQELRGNPKYTCNVNTGDVSDRFVISFQRLTGTNSLTNISKSILIRGFEEKVDIKFLNQNEMEASVLVYNLLGREVFSSEKSTISSGELSLSLTGIETGVYFVKVVTASNTFSQKVYLGH